MIHRPPAALGLLSQDATSNRISLRSRTTCLFDGRLDNRREMQSALNTHGATDADVVGAAYDRWGPYAFRKLRGEYALALWDPENRRLYLARDPVGLRPLYYACSHDTLSFATEAKALLSLPDLPRKPDTERLHEMNTGRYRSSDRTFFEGVQRIVPGEFLQATREGVARGRLWDPDLRSSVRFPSPEGYRAQFRELFFNAVRRCMPRKGTVGVLLSGGIDSSSVTAVAAEIARREGSGVSVEAFSLYSDRFPDERLYCEEVVRTAGIRGHAIRADDISLSHDLSQRLFEQEIPPVPPEANLFDRVYKEAARRGVRVLLSGHWGDQVMLSHALLADLLASGRWFEAWKYVRGYRRQDRAAAGPLLRCAASFLVLRRRSTPDFPSRAQKEVYENVFEPVNVLFREALELASAHRGLRFQMPFLDLDLIEFVLAIPATQRVSNGVGKQLLRESLSDLLPARVRERKDKRDYTLSIPPRLAQAGFSGDTPDDLSEHWFRHAREQWSKAWFDNP